MQSSNDSLFPLKCSEALHIAHSALLGLVERFLKQRRHLAILTAASEQNGSADLDKDMLRVVDSLDRLTLLTQVKVLAISAQIFNRGRVINTTRFAIKC